MRINPSPIKLTFFGDSTFAGQGVSLHSGWVTRVAAALHDKRGPDDREIIVANSSVNGRTTRQALEDMPYHIQSHSNDIVIVQFGLNDCNYWQSDKGLPRVSKAAFVGNLNEIIDRCLAFGAYRVLVNTNHPTSRTGVVMEGTSLTYEDSNSEYNVAIRDVCGERGPEVAFQDIEDHFNIRIAAGEKLVDLLIDDGLHLSARGHEIYFEVMYPVIWDSIKLIPTAV